VTDYRLLLDKIARTTADLVGDGCIVTLIDEDGETLFNAASTSRSGPGGSLPSVSRRHGNFEDDQRNRVRGRGLDRVRGAAQRVSRLIDDLVHARVGLELRSAVLNDVP